MISLRALAANIKTCLAPANSHARRTHARSALRMGKRVLNTIRLCAAAGLRRSRNDPPVQPQGERTRPEFDLDLAALASVNLPLNLVSMRGLNMVRNADGTVEFVFGGFADELPPIEGGPARRHQRAASYETLVEEFL